MSERLRGEVGTLMVELIEKVGLLRRDMQHRQELEAYAARFQRIEQKLLALADRVAADDPTLAETLRAAWRSPARSLAFRNAGHRKKGEAPDQS